MGQVYQATDTKLHREVALKVLPQAFTDDPDRLARFEREATVLASLNHTNIGHIYGLEEAEGQKALVLELVEGPTLADRIAQGPIPIDEALPIAKQIAEALEAAHEAGVIHRDLKPANIKVRDDGTVKVLDFGLAKAFQPDANDPNLSQSPTISLTAAATQMGMVIGTAAYMAPEQAKGKVVDKRADVWAFGAVLFEMLTGKKPFVGDDVSDTLAAVLRADVDLDALPDDTPATLRRVISACLQKDPKQRVHDVADVRLAMAGAFETAVGTSTALTPQPASWRQALPLALGVSAVAVVVTAIAVWSLMGTTASTPRVIRSSMAVPAAASVGFGFGHNNIAISPSGTHLVYSTYSTGQLYLRAMDQLEATPIPRTEGAIEPFFSPNGQWIAFWADGELKKISVSGGAPVTLCQINQFFGASWSPDDTILLGSSAGVWGVPGSGGTPTVVVPPHDSDTGMLRPQLLPGGEWVLFSQQNRQNTIYSLVTGERQVLIENGGDVTYLPTGHLAYVADGTLLAVPFDVERRIVTGGPVPLAEGVAQGPSGLAQFGHAADGTLVYQRGGAQSGQSRTLVWVDRQGNEMPLDLPEASAYIFPRLSPDGTRLAVAVQDDNIDVWVSELALGTLRRLTTDPAIDLGPLWSVDGESVVFASQREGPWGLFSMAWDGTGDAERLMVIEDIQNLQQLLPYGWSADGALLFEYVAANGSSDIGMLPMDGDGTWEPLLDGDADEQAPAISPDGQWIAYTSDRTGTREVYVQRLPELGGEQLISRGGGMYPVWARDGRELVYQRPGAGLMVAPVAPGADLQVGVAEPLFDITPYYSTRFSRAWDLSPDGQQLLMITLGGGATTEADAQTEIIVVQNWFEEVKERVPVD